MSDETERRLVNEALNQVGGFDDVTRAADHVRSRRVKPDSIPGYSITREIHRGGQGIVYQAIQESTQRTVAVKVLRESLFSTDADRQRFEREVRVLSFLKHPNIVTIHDSGSHDSIAYFVMDYIPGLPLDLHVSGGQLDTRRVLQIFEAICNAVNAAHVRGVTHRDLKPGNIRVDETGAPHVLDFGLAKLSQTDTDSPAMTVTGQFVGSVPWAAPEQARATPYAIDTRTDVYALGVLLYQVLTGAFPYDVTGPIQEVLDRISNDAPIRPSRISKRVDSEIETLILRCLQKDPDRRYQTAGELGRDIRRYLAGEPIEAKRDSTWYVFRKLAWRHRVAVAVSLTFLLMLVGATFVTTMQWRRARIAELNERDQRKIADATIVVQGSMFDKLDLRKMASGLAEDLEARYAKIRDAQDDNSNGGLPEVDDLKQALAAINLKDVARDIVGRDLLATAVATIDERFAGKPELIKIELQQRDSISRLYTSLGLFQQALRQAEQAHDLALKTEDLDPRTVAASYTNVGLLYSDLGQYEQAEKALVTALEMTATELGPYDVDTIKAYDNLASLAFKARNYDEALKLQDKALAALRANPNDNAERRIGVLGNRAVTLSRVDRLEEAEQTYIEAIDECVKLYGPEHRKVGHFRRNLAVMLLRSNRIEEAHALVASSANIAEKNAGQESQDYIQAIEVLAEVHRRQGDMDRWLSALRSIREWKVDRLGPDHPDSIDTAEQLAKALSSQGETGEADRILTEAVAAAAQHFGPDSERECRLRHTLYKLYLDDAPAKSEKQVRKIITIYEARGWKTQPHYARYLSELGNALYRQERYQEAEPVFLDSFGRLAATMGADHPQLASLRRLIDRFYDAWMDQDDSDDARAAAERWHRRFADP